MILNWKILNTLISKNISFCKVMNKGYSPMGLVTPTHILAFEGDSRVVFLNGNWTDYEADRKKRLGTDANVPKRIKYRQLTR